MNAEQVIVPAGCRIIIAPTSPQDEPQALFASLPEVVDSKAAATALSIPERTLRELARSGEIKGFKVGSVWRFTRRCLVEYVERQEAALTMGAEE